MGNATGSGANKFRRIQQGGLDLSSPERRRGAVIHCSILGLWISRRKGQYIRQNLCFFAVF
jgi:hypothetical protein